MQLVDGAGHTLRQVNQALDYLEKRGEIILHAGIWSQSTGISELRPA